MTSDRSSAVMPTSADVSTGSSSRDGQLQSTDRADLLEFLLQAALRWINDRDLADFSSPHGPATTPPRRPEALAAAEATLESVDSELSSGRRRVSELEALNRSLESRLQNLERISGSAHEVAAEADSLRLELGRERRLAAEAKARASKESMEIDARHTAEIQKLRAQLRGAEQRARSAQTAAAVAAKVSPKEADLTVEVQKLGDDLGASEQEVRRLSDLLEAARMDYTSLRKCNAQLLQVQDACRFCRDRRARADFPEMPPSSIDEDFGLQDDISAADCIREGRTYSFEEETALGLYQSNRTATTRPKTASGSSQSPPQLEFSLPARPSSALPKPSVRAVSKDSGTQKTRTGSSCSTRASTRLGGSSRYEGSSTREGSSSDSPDIHAQAPMPLYSSFPERTRPASAQSISEDVEDIASVNCLASAGAMQADAWPETSLVSEVDASRSHLEHDASSAQASTVDRLQISEGWPKPGLPQPSSPPASARRPGNSEIHHGVPRLEHSVPKSSAGVDAPQKSANAPSSIDEQQAPAGFAPPLPPGEPRLQGPKRIFAEQIVRPEGPASSSSSEAALPSRERESEQSGAHHRMAWKEQEQAESKSRETMLTDARDISDWSAAAVVAEATPVSQAKRAGECLSIEQWAKAKDESDKSIASFLAQGDKPENPIAYLQHNVNFVREQRLKTGPAPDVDGGVNGLLGFWDDLQSERFAQSKHVFDAVFRPKPPDEPPPVLTPKRHSPVPQGVPSVLPLMPRGKRDPGQARAEWAAAMRSQPRPAQPVSVP